MSFGVFERSPYRSCEARILKSRPTTSLHIGEEGSIELRLGLSLSGNDRGKWCQTGERDTDLGLGGV